MSFHRLFNLIVVSCLICFTVGTASAQVTLDLSGAENMWFYGYYGQLGSRGFFGGYDVDASSTGGNFASLNAWIGNQPDINQLVSGSNAGISQLNLKITPKYGNDWARLQARYNINAYNTSAAPGSVTPLSPGQLTLWLAHVRTPLGTIRFGKQVFQHGFNLQFSDVRTTEYLMLDRTYSVPDVLGCLVCSGLLPKKAMSWFNPEFWPCYKPTNYDKPYPFGNENYTEPEDELYRHPEKNKSRFKVWEEERQAQRDALKEELALLTEKLKCFTEAKPKPGDPAICDECLDDCAAQNPARFTVDRIKELQTRIAVIKAEQDAGQKSENLDQCREKHWPSDQDGYAWGHIGPACLRIGVGFFPWETFTLPTPVAPPFFPFWNPQDLGINQTQNFIALVAYSSTDLEFGVGCLRSTYHQGPELRQSVALRISTPTFERYVTEGWAYLKYNNGRFLFNTELDWFNRIYRFQRSLNGTYFGIPDNVDGSGSLFASKYWESWRYMAEAGFWCGPFAARGFYCFMPGPDRRHGVLIDRQPFIQELPQQAFGLFDPYSMILAYRFGSGVNAPAHISDASVYALKLDYALASNLIVAGSFLRAVRNTNGYAIGYVRPNIAAGGFGSVVYAEPPGSTFTNPAPSIPDRDLGWEATAGFVWELLEGWALSARFSYWQPGKWFNYACIDKGVLNWDIPSALNNWGVRPDRVIDPVFGLEIQIGTRY